MKIKVAIKGGHNNEVLKDGDIGYIDGYVPISYNEVLAVVVVGRQIGSVPISSLEVLDIKDREEN